MQELTRRTFVQTAGALVVSAALPSFGVAQRGDGRTAYRFFSASDRPQWIREHLVQRLTQQPNPAKMRLFRCRYGAHVFPDRRGAHVCIERKHPRPLSLQPPCTSPLNTISF